MTDSAVPTSMKTFDPKALSIAVAGDIHLGHPRTPTERIIDALCRAFPHTEASRELDFIVLNGDVFDQGLRLDSDLRTPITLWVIQFLQFCKKHDIVARVVEGTPYHDNKQSGLFDELNKAVGADVKYVKDLEIEYIERFNAYILYVPDEWRSTAAETQEEIKALLAANGISKVDFSFVHGYFHYQLPEIAHEKEEAHDIDFFHAITRYDIFISHVHVFSQNNRVTAPGSIERLAHGEEGPKGHVRRTEKGIEFVINKNAHVYKTVVCTGQTLEQAYNTIREVVSGDIHDGAYVRVEAAADDHILSTMHQLRKEFPHVKFSKPKIAGKKDSKTVMDPVKIKPIDKIPTLTKDNIASYLMTRLAVQAPDIQALCLEILEDEINAV